MHGNWPLPRVENCGQIKIPLEVHPLIRYKISSALDNLSAPRGEKHNMNRIFKFAATGALVLGFATAGTAATVTIQSIGGTPVYGTLSYTGADSAIQGFYSGALNDTLAERYASGNNAYESALVAGIAGLPGLSLGGTELAISGSSTTIEAYTYFTTKFAQSLAVFYNGSAGAIEVSFSSEGCTAISRECGGISHYKHVTVDGPPSVVPLPAAGLMLLTALGGLGFARRRKA